MFRICETNTGFHITFANGWTVSVQFGGGTYSDHHLNFAIIVNPEKGIESKTAEIAAWDKDANWYEFENGDRVNGYCTPEQVAEFIHMISKKKTSET